VSIFSGPSVSQHALPNVPQHLAVLAGTEIVPATSTSLSDASTTDLSVVPGYHYMPNAVPVTVHGAHNSSEVVPATSGSRKGLLKHRRHVTVFCICLYFRSNLRWFWVRSQDWDGVVSIATGYGLDDQEVRVWVPVVSKIFSTSSGLTLGSTQHTIKWVPGALSPGVKRPGRESDRSPPASAEVNKRWIYTSTPPYAFMV
jgi:hypothetical protein